MSELVSLIQKEYHRRIFEESYSRIENCISRITDDQVWQKPNDNTNSIGNLVLHLMGNVRQYVCSGIGGQTDTRVRDEEFLESSRCSKEELFLKMKSLQTDSLKVVDQLTEENLQTIYGVQGLEESGMSIMIHVIEHFSYHIGQIALYTKLLVDEDLGFYAGLDLNAKSK